MEYLRSVAITLTGSAQRVFPAASAQPKIQSISFVVPTGAAFLGDSSVTTSTGAPLGATPQQFRARGLDVISPESLYLIGTAAVVVIVTYLECK